MDRTEYAAHVERLTRAVIEALALEALRAQPREEVPQWLGPRVATVVRAAGGTHDQARSVMDEILGLGPLELLLRDADNREIRVHGAHRIEVVREGEAADAPVVFSDEAHAQRVFARILRAVSKKLGPEEVSAEMLDGSQLTAQLVDGAVHATIIRP